MNKLPTTLHIGLHYSLEDYRGFLLCVEPAGHKKRENGRVVATRSRPGPWEKVSFQPVKGKKLKHGDVIQSNSSINIVSDVHNTTIQVDQSGLVTSSHKSKNSTTFHIEYHKTSNGCFFLALKTSDGRYLGTTKSGKLLCNKAKANRVPPPMCFFRVFTRNQEFDDRRLYLPLGYKGNMANLEQVAIGPKPTFDDVVAELCGRFLLSLPQEELQDANRLFYHIEQMWWFYEDHKADELSHLPHMRHQEFGRQVFRLCNLFEPVVNQYDALYGAYKEYLTSVPVFGVFIMNAAMNKVVLVKSYNGSWLGFPRGKVNQSEAEVECAIREAKEEIGLDLYGCVESSSYLRFKEGEKWVKLFLVNNIPEDKKFETQTRKEIGNISWYDLSKSKSLLPNDQWRYLNRWIKSKKKEQRAQAVAANNAKHKSKNWQQSWGLDALLTGVDGGGGMFVDEEYDENGFAVTDKTQQQKRGGGGGSGSSRGSDNTKSHRKGETKRQQNDTKKELEKQTTKTVTILKKRKKNDNLWKKDSIFQSAGKFKLDRDKVLAFLP